MKGLSEFDQPHAVLWRIDYRAPTLRNAHRAARSILGGWQVSSVVLWKSGTPFGIRAGSDSPGIGNVDGAGSDRPNLLDPSILGQSVNHPDTSRASLDPTAFAFIRPTDPGGDLGRNTFRKDSVWNVNVAFSRRILERNGTSMLFRAESLNFPQSPSVRGTGRQSRLTPRSAPSRTRSTTGGRSGSPFKCRSERLDDEGGEVLTATPASGGPPSRTRMALQSSQPSVRCVRRIRQVARFPE